MQTNRFLFFFSFLLLLTACREQTPTTADTSAAGATTDFKVDFEQFKLDNGLQVVLHVDRSDPVVAVALTSHVGSAREITGRTGFAHLFEHLLFLESENLGKGGLDKMSARIGGSGANGSTSRDRTNYFQTVPRDALEKMIWAEADKLGYFINTVTDPVLAKEKQVVKNEKRQGVDNQPYGHTGYVIDKNLYPEGHPYNWQVIGSLEDLDNATLQNVKDFFNRWYVPNNVTLVIAGDFDPAQARKWVDKYFGEIKRGEDIPAMQKQPVMLAATKKLYHEDNFARLPELTLTWPSVYEYADDAYPLSVLATYLSEGKKAPLNQVLVEDKQLTAEVEMYDYTSEVAGQFTLSVRAFADTPLDSVLQGIETAFAKFEAAGISESDLERIKAGQETAFYRGLSSVLGKGFQLAQYQIFANDPGFINQDVKNILAVTREDVMRVYEQYVKGKNYIATSFVPKGQRELALMGSVKADVVEEAIVQGAEQTFDLSDTAAYTRTSSSFDRTIEPAYGESPELSLPTIWQDELGNGMKLYGIENDEVPLVQFRIVIRGGQLLDQAAKPGVANMVAESLTKGTRTKTTEELENAIEKLGASINVYATEEDITITGSTLSRNYAATMALVEEILTQPRWDDAEFELTKQRVVSQLQQQAANPNSIAAQQFQQLLYGKDHILAYNILGTEAALGEITLQDLRQYHEQYISPSVTTVHLVGDIDKKAVVSSLSSLEQAWAAKAVTLPEYPTPVGPTASQVYFYDVPGAKQSVLYFGYPALRATDADYYPAQVMNYRLGGGGFASQLTQQLREGKGYTYGIRSSFSGSQLVGPFQVTSGVRSNVTYESASLVKDILQQYGKNFTEDDLEVTQGYMVKSSARAFETMNAKLGMLTNISGLGWPEDYAKKQVAEVQKMTVADIQRLAEQYIRPDKMYYLVVGDAATQLSGLSQLGYGKPVLLNQKPLQ